MDEEDYRIRHQLMFEAERELLKNEEPSNGLNFYSIFGETVAGVGEEYEVKLSFHSETPPALVVSGEAGFVGMFYLRDLEVQSLESTAKGGLDE